MGRRSEHWSERSRRANPLGLERYNPGWRGSPLAPGVSAVFLLVLHVQNDSATARCVQQPLPECPEGRVLRDFVFTQARPSWSN